jgi:hypothetical protein
MPDNEILKALLALAEGRWEDWRGLPPGCERAHVEQVFGSSGPGPDGAGYVAGQAISFRRYPAPQSAAGAVVWLHGSAVIAIQLNTPVAEQWKQVLGPPEDVTRSLLFTLGSQWIYASRGLTLHAGSDGLVSQLFAYAAMTVDEFNRSWMSQVEMRRHRIRK